MSSVKSADLRLISGEALKKKNVLGGKRRKKAIRKNSVPQSSERKKNLPVASGCLLRGRTLASKKGEKICPEEKGRMARLK